MRGVILVVPLRGCLLRFCLELTELAFALSPLTIDSPSSFSFYIHSFSPALKTLGRSFHSITSGSKGRSAFTPQRKIGRRRQERKRQTTISGTKEGR